MRRGDGGSVKVGAGYSEVVIWKGGGGKVDIE